MSRARIFVDTNAILEAHRTTCWKAIVNTYQVETVEEVVVECASGDSFRRDYIPIDTAELRRQVQVRSASSDALIELALKLAGTVSLDLGEKHLIAYALEQKRIWNLCSPDKEAIRAMVKLGLQARLVSLEEVAARSGVNPKLKGQYRKMWLRRTVNLFVVEVF